MKPDWLKVRVPLGVPRVFGGLHTICESGLCPNRAECWGRGTATFMILGDVCTRGCRFCATLTGLPGSLDAGEAERVARSVRAMGLRHVVLTSVCRDDLGDGGAGHWAAVVRAVRDVNPGVTVELLIPDYTDSVLDVVLDSGPDIVGHNVETVERLTPSVRSRASYRGSLETLRQIAAKGFRAKSGLMVGMGESEGEVLGALDDLRGVGVSIVTLGQYLQPSKGHLDVAEYVKPEVFEFYREEALKRGFMHVASGPLVRSSYMAEEALCG